MMGWMSVGTAYPLAVSHALSAFGSVDWSCTVSYGPTVCCEMTLTAPASAAAVGPPPPLELPLAPPKSPHEHDGHGGRFGASMVVCVATSSAANTTSELRPTA